MISDDTEVDDYLDYSSRRCVAFTGTEVGCVMLLWQADCRILMSPFIYITFIYCVAIIEL